MLAKFLIGTIRLYQEVVSPWTPPSCRYTPSCSSYAIEAVERHGSARGAWLAMRRVGRCHPWGGHGFDPVPAAVDGGMRTDKGEHRAGAEDSVSLGRMNCAPAQIDG